MNNSQKNIQNSSEGFIIEDRVSAKAHNILNNDTLKDFWLNFSHRTSEISFSETDELIFIVGDVEKPVLDENSYAISVNKSGACVVAKSEKDLIYGYIKLISLIKRNIDGDKPVTKIEKCEIKESPLVKNRMVHFCIFADTELWELERFVRFAGALRYTHLVLEFWGMLKYDCLKELAWPHAYAKDDIRPIIKQANELGIEVIPMFNHWGHAALSRVMHGKHVVLDQNPSLQYYFSSDGWCWDISKEQTRDLLRKIRLELIELCGESEYFHIGCDEAYGFDFTEENMDMICSFINGVSAEMNAIGKKIIMWGDMLLYNSPDMNPKNKYATSCPNAKTQNYMMSKIDRSVIIGDWQYTAKEYPIETALIFKEAGFTCLICPYDEGDSETDACMKTIKEHGLFGIMHTTWHTLSSGMPYVLKVAASCWKDISIVDCDPSVFQTNTATLLRKAYFVNNCYKKAGWSKHDIGFKW